MLEFYMDDSGTHEDAPVAVWGGVVGHQTYLDQLTTAWQEQLLEPCEGRPPIKAFHSFDLEHSLGEFVGYKQGERDRTRRNFRKVIVDSGVTVLAFGVSIKDWDQVVIKLGRIRGLTAENAAFGQAFKAGLGVSISTDEPISFQFDRGRDTPELRRLIKPALDAVKVDDRFVSYGFLPVKKVPALQAADLVAHEAYRYFKQYQKDRKAKPGVHTLRLFEDVYSSQAGWVGRRQIRDMVTQFHKKQRRKG